MPDRDRLLRLGILHPDGVNRDHASWLGQCTRDAFRHGEERWDVVCNIYTLPYLRRAVENVSFFTDIAEVKDPVTAILSKILPARCQARKYGTVAEKAFIESLPDTRKYQEITTDVAWIEKRYATNPGKFKDQIRFVRWFRGIRERRLQFQRVFLCSLLGNYEHSTTRLMGEARDIAYKLFWDEAESAHSVYFFQSILHVCPMLFVWTVRDFVRIHKTITICVRYWY